MEVNIFKEKEDILKHFLKLSVNIFGETLTLSSNEMNFAEEYLIEGTTFSEIF